MRGCQLSQNLESVPAILDVSPTHPHARTRHARTNPAPVFMRAVTPQHSSHSHPWQSSAQSAGHRAAIRQILSLYRSASSKQALAVVQSKRTRQTGRTGRPPLPGQKSGNEVPGCDFSQPGPGPGGDINKYLLYQFPFPLSTSTPPSCPPSCLRACDKAVSSRLCFFFPWGIHSPTACCAERRILPPHSPIARHLHTGPACAPAADPLLNHPRSNRETSTACPAYLTCGGPIGSESGA